MLEEIIEDYLLEPKTVFGIITNTISGLIIYTKHTIFLLLFFSSWYGSTDWNLKGLQMESM